MILNSGMYVPALRWRLGEYQGLSRLNATAKTKVMPYITIPEVEFDFDAWLPAKSIQQHVRPFAARYKTKWGQHPAWIGVHPSIAGGLMDDSRDILTYVFEGLRTFDARAIPAIPLDAPASLVAAVAAISLVDGLGASITVKLEDLMKLHTRTRIESLVGSLGLSLVEVDLIIDLGAPNFEPYAAFAVALVAAITKLGDLHAFRNFVLIGTAIPQSFKDVAKGSGQLPRHDWLFYLELLSKLPLGTRRPNFGDYTVVHPEFTPMDMRKLNPAGKLVYTTDGAWEVRKGGSFRDNRDQMHDHCASIVSSGKFNGPHYSSGDDYIARCAAKTEGPSNQSRWKEVAINHHMTHVLHDLATLGA